MARVHARPLLVVVLSLLTAACGGDGPLGPGTGPPDAAPPPEVPPGDPAGPGPYLVRDIHPGGAPSFGDAPTGQFFAFRGRLFFVANDGVHGTELWHTDGTAAGTQMAADICPGSCSADPGRFTRIGDAVVFRAANGVHGQELWTTDGTAGGTRMVADLWPGSESGLPFMFAPLGERVLIQAAGPGASLGLWSTDGTAGGTTLLRVLSPLSVAPPSALQAAAGDRVFFGADDGDSGHELWVTDGTTDGTRLVRDICPGRCAGAERLRGTVFDGRVYLAGRGAPGAPTELWVSDGTASGTRSTGIPFFALTTPVVFRDALFFSTGPTSGGRELWRTDGTTRGTWRVAPIAAGSFYEWGGLLFVGAGHDVWVTDGYLAGQIPAFAATGFAGLGGHVYFDAWSEAHGSELWRSDGSVEGTSQVADLRTGPEGSLRATFQIVAFGDRVFFPANDGRAGLELWAYRPPR